MFFHTYSLTITNYSTTEKYANLSKEVQLCNLFCNFKPSFYTAMTSVDKAVEAAKERAHLLVNNKYIRPL